MVWAIDHAPQIWQTHAALGQLYHDTDRIDQSRQHYQAARERIAAIAPPTPLIFSPWLSDHIDREVFLKLECLQVTGSFKLRGAANKILTLDVAQRRREEQILDAMRFA